MSIVSHCLVLISWLLGSSPAPEPEPAALASGAGLHFIDVGQGAALLVVGEGGELVLIDSGPAGAAEAILAALAVRNRTSIDLVVHTHHDADHIGGFARVLAGLDGQLGSADDIELGQVWDRGLAAPLPDSEALALYLALSGRQRVEGLGGARFEAAGLDVEVLALDAPAAEEAGENARGLALCVELGGLRLLVPGDLPAARAAQAAAGCGPVDVLWLSHHGAVDGSSAELLALADPEHIVISAGHGNPHCHPATATMARIYDRSTWLLDAAGLEPGDPCPPLAESLSPLHTLVGGDLWIPADP